MPVATGRSIALGAIPNYQQRHQQLSMDANALTSEMPAAGFHCSSITADFNVV
jgi:uncharacterized protein Smg (DUF494 family)